MTKFHVVWHFENGAIAMTDVIKAHDAVDAHNKAQKMATNITVQDSLHRKVVVGTITRLQT